MTARPRAFSAPKHRHGPVHVAQEDPDAPGCCITCHRPMTAPNDRHVDQLPAVDPDITAAEHRRLGERGDWP